MIFKLRRPLEVINLNIETGERKIERYSFHHPKCKCGSTVECYKNPNPELVEVDIPHLRDERAWFERQLHGLMSLGPGINFHPSIERALKRMEEKRKLNEK